MIRRKENAETLRASWTGSVQFGLVVFPVKAYNAVKPHAGSIRFHQLHAGCHERIRHAKVCPIHGELESDEIVSGYEYEKGKFVEFTPEELRELRTDSDRIFAVDNFVKPEQVDPIYFDGRMYFLAPDGAAARPPYDVFYRALKNQSRYGVGTIDVFGRSQLAVVRPHLGLLHVAMLNYDAEVRHPDDIPESSRVRAPEDDVQLAELLIQTWSREDFNLSDYVNPRNERFAELLEAKLRGREADLGYPPPSRSVTDLRAALEASLKRLQPSGPRGNPDPLGAGDRNRGES